MVQWLGIGTFTGWGTTIPQAIRHGWKKKKSYLGFHFYEIFRVVILIETKVEWWLPGAGGKDKNRNLFNRYCFTFAMQTKLQKKFWQSDA